ncbi:hypothetical protein DL95DRAFT_467086 [Leptodontidium sp. 2 PMI_412]|nr:hypothetical protein DL95DRAFT_467086 [Leptodontidium sp. 2 PMI_412]
MEDEIPDHISTSTSQIARLTTNGSLSPIFNIVCPGMIRTNIARDFASKSFFFKIVEAVFMSILSNPADVGARSLVLIASTTLDQHGTFRNPILMKDEYAVQNVGSHTYEP